jgi:hypothetical protein
MSMLAHLIAGLVLFAGIHPSINGPDASWVEGLYDDGDFDSLIYALAMGDHVFPSNLALQVFRVAHVPVFMGWMILPGDGTPFARWYFTPTVRGPPLHSQVCSYPLSACSKSSSGRFAPPTRLWQRIFGCALFGGTRLSPGVRAVSAPGSRGGMGLGVAKGATTLRRLGAGHTRPPGDIVKDPVTSFSLDSYFAAPAPPLSVQRPRASLGSSGSNFSTNSGSSSDFIAATGTGSARGAAGPREGRPRTSRPAASRAPCPGPR